jgi:hypothetical protein
MLRVEMHNSANSLSLKLEGRFTGDDAESTRTLITRCREGMRLVVDLTDVIFIDSVGEEVLSFFGRSGAEFAAPTSYTLDVTPFAEKRPTYTTLTLFQKRETLKSPVNTSLLEIRVRVSTAFPPSCNFLRRSLSAVSPGTYGMPGCGQRMSPL